MTRSTIPAYLYTFRNGELKVQKGKFLKYTSYQGRFYVDDRRFYQCSPEEGYLVGCKVWFRERDDDRAKDIFVRYMNKKIEKAHRDIERCDNNIHVILNTELKL